MDSGVRYGMVGQPVAVEEASSGARAQIPDEASKMLRHEFGGPFLVSRDQVQVELQLSREQKEKLNQNLLELLPDAVQFFQKMGRLKGEDASSNSVLTGKRHAKNLRLSCRKRSAKTSVRVCASWNCNAKGFAMGRPGNFSTSRKTNGSSSWVSSCRASEDSAAARRGAENRQPQGGSRQGDQDPRWPRGRSAPS